MNYRRLLATAVAALPFAGPVMSLAADAAPNDSFIAGYAAAVLEREMAIKANGLAVHDGHVTLTRPSLSRSEQTQVIKVLTSIPGVRDVSLVDGDTETTPAKKPIETLSLTPTTGPSQASSTATAGGSTGNTVAAADNEPSLSLSTAPTPVTLWLGVGRAFEPLLADPRWPHFYASYQHYTRDTGDTKLSGVGSVGFGETISFLKQSFDSGFRWEAGIQGGLFAIFDMDSDSKDLINADYFVGPYVSMRQGDFSLMARVFHQSSHLGDEYLLRSNSDPRQNYSFEQLNLLASYDLPNGFRVYGGAGYKFDVDPQNIDKWSIQYGVEWLSPTTAFGTNWLRPVAALDVQNQEEDDWAFSYSLRAGVQFEDPARFTQRMQLMFEFYDGNSRNGQFYDSHIQYYGLGIHFYF